MALKRNPLEAAFKKFLDKHIAPTHRCIRTPDLAPSIRSGRCFVKPAQPLDFQIYNGHRQIEVEAKMVGKSNRFAFLDRVTAHQRGEFAKIAATAAASHSPAMVGALLVGFMAGEEPEAYLVPWAVYAPAEAAAAPRKSLNVRDFRRVFAAHRFDFTPASFFACLGLPAPDPPF